MGYSPDHPLEGELHHVGCDDLRKDARIDIAALLQREIGLPPYTSSSSPIQKTAGLRWSEVSQRHRRLSDRVDVAHCDRPAGSRAVNELRARALQQSGVFDQ